MTGRLYARSGLALGVGLASGAIAAWAGLPLPWMLGPMIGNTVAAMLRAPVAGPERLRPVVVPIIGVMLGSGLTMEVVAAAGRWAVTFLLLPPFLIAAAALSYFFYRRIGRYDPITAFYSAMPGGLNEMLILGEEAGGDAKRIALAHASRVLLVILFVVLFFGFVLGVGTSNAARETVALGALTPSDILWLTLAAVLGVPLARLLRLPAASVFGPMVLSGAVHIAGLVHVAPPTLLVIGAQIVVGTIIGCRFAGTSPREVGHDLVLAAGSSLSMITVAVAFALVVTALTGTDLRQSFLAYSPGGLTEMSLLALAMGKDATYVSVTHIARIALVVFAAPLAFRWLGR